ncbi:MAG: hypothetical protein Q8R24_02900 [Legionellaceae bacterium]|nr:hypothetical protein [Legionellaceae bacterium]
MSFSKRLAKIQFMVDRLSLLHRIAILCGLLFIIYIPWFFVIYRPQTVASTEIQQQITHLQNQTNILQRKYANILILAKNHDVDKLIIKYKSLQQQLQDLNQHITHFHHSYISDKELAALVHAILEDIDNIKIENFSTVAKVAQPLVSTPLPVAVAPKPGASPIPMPPTVSTVSNPSDMIHYSLSLRGDYFSIMKFLQRVESIKWQLFWETFHYQVIHYPEALASVEFYTLKPASVTPILTKGVSK